MENSSSEYKSFRISGIPASAFGESYLIATATLDSIYKSRCECFIISRRMEPRLKKLSCEYETPDELPESLKITIDFLLEEAKHQAQLFLETKLEEIYEKAGKPLLPITRVELLAMGNNPLHSLWFRDQLREEIKDIAQSTKCNKLKLYLEILVKSVCKKVTVDAT